MKSYITLILGGFVLLSTVTGCKSKSSAEKAQNRENEMRYNFSGIEEINTDNIKELEKRDTPATIIDIFSKGSGELTEASLIFDVVSAIPLETTQECLIGNIDKLISDENRIYILDRYKGKQLFSFDKNGKFLNLIGVAGRGPGEYIEPTDFYLDKEKNEIVVWDQFSHRFTHYNMEGKMVSSSRIAARFREIYFDPSSRILWCSSAEANENVEKLNGYNLLALDSTLTKIIYRADYNPLSFNYEIDYDNMICENKFLYHPQLSDTIFELTTEGTSPKYIFNVKDEYKIPQSAWIDCNGNLEIMQEKYFDNHIILNNVNRVFDNHLLTTITFNKELYYILYNTQQNTFKLFFPIVYDLLEERPQLANVAFIQSLSASCCDGDLFTISIPAHFLSKIHETELSNYNLTNITEDANPIVVTMKLK